jgi:hypothetical protein
VQGPGPSYGYDVEPLSCHKSVSVARLYRLEVTFVRVVGARVNWVTIGIVVVMSGMTLPGCGGLTGLGDDEELGGSWKWLASTGGIAGMTQTPESTGEPLTLSILENDSVEVVRDGDLEGTIHSSLTATGDPLNYDQPLFGFATQTVSLAEADVLVLTDPSCDGFEYRPLRAE